MAARSTLRPLLPHSNKPEAPLLSSQSKTSNQFSCGDDTPDFLLEWDSSRASASSLDLEGLLRGFTRLFSITRAEQPRKFLTRSAGLSWEIQDAFLCSGRVQLVGLARVCPKPCCAA